MCVRGGLRDILVRVALQCLLAAHGFSCLIQRDLGGRHCEVEDGSGERKEVGAYMETCVNYDQNHEFATFWWYLNHSSTMPWYKNSGFLAAIEAAHTCVLKYFWMCRRQHTL
jgi:hypothetical protein